MLDGVRREFIDQKTEGHGTIGVDFQRLGLLFRCLTYFQ
jgi:hypothetical protein